MLKGKKGLGVFFLVLIFIAVSSMMSVAKVHLVEIAPSGPEFGGAAVSMAKVYMQRNPDVKVTVDVFPYEEYVVKVAVDLAGGGGTYDFIWMDPWYLGSYVSSNYIASLDDYLAKDPAMKADVYEDFVSKQLKYNTWNGKLYAIPHHSNATHMFYRKDLLINAGVEKPTSYSQLLEIAPKLHNPPKVYAIGGHYQRFWATDAWLSLLWASGGEIYDPETYVPQLDSPEALKAATTFKEVVKWAPSDALTWGEGGVNDAMGSAGIIAVLPSTYSSPIAADPEMFKYAPIIGVSTSPSVDGRTEGGSLLAGWTSALCNNSSNKDEAWKFIKWFTSRKSQEMWLFKFGAHPARISILTSYRAQILDPALPVIVDSMARAGLRPQISGSAKIQSIIGVELDRIITGQKSPKDALLHMQSAITDVLKEAGRIK